MRRVKLRQVKMIKESDDTGIRPSRGRPFKQGNSGRPPGSRNKVTVALESFLDGHAEAIMAKAVELALAGDRVALRLCLERALSVRQERPVSLDLQPINSATDAALMLAKIIAGVAAGEITPKEGEVISEMIKSAIGAFQEKVLEDRLATIETSLLAIKDQIKKMNNKFEARLKKVEDEVGVLRNNIVVCPEQRIEYERDRRKQDLRDIDARHSDWYLPVARAFYEWTEKTFVRLKGKHRDTAWLAYYTNFKSYPSNTEDFEPAAKEAFADWYTAIFASLRERELDEVVFIAMRYQLGVLVRKAFEELVLDVVPVDARHFEWVVQDGRRQARWIGQVVDEEPLENAPVDGDLVGEETEQEEPEPLLHQASPDKPRNDLDDDPAQMVVVNAVANWLRETFPPKVGPKIRRNFKEQRAYDMENVRLLYHYNEYWRERRFNRPPRKPAFRRTAEREFRSIWAQHQSKMPCGEAEYTAYRSEINKIERKIYWQIEHDRHGNNPRRYHWNANTGEVRIKASGPRSPAKNAVRGSADEGDA